MSKNELGTIDTSGITVVDTSEEGVNIKEFFESIDGTDPAEVQFSDVTIPIANLIMESPQGRPNAAIHILRERLCQAAISIGMAIFAFRITAELLKNTSTTRTSSQLTLQKGQSHEDFGWIFRCLKVEHQSRSV